MGGLYEVLQKIQAKPGMYIRRASVSDLFHFLVGYEFARGELDIEPTEWEDDFHENFQPWIQKKYHVSTSNSWAKIIMLHCGNEQEGFNAFYKLLDEFQNRDKSLDGDWFDDLKRKQVSTNQQELLPSRQKITYLKNRSRRRVHRVREIRD